MITHTIPAALGVVHAKSVSSALVQLVEQVRPSVVQVRTGGRGVGTGVIWHQRGGIVTNHHVVANGGPAIQVLLNDDRLLDAVVVARNPALDLALLRVADHNLPAAGIGDSAALRVGELVFAIGNPLGRRDVVTAGIVSGLGSIRSRDGEQAQYIRSDVLLAPGNSGGPLLNARGDVVGINAMIFGGDLSVAIPSLTASSWLAALPERPASLGVGVRQAALPAAAPSQLDGPTAALLVVSLVPGGPGERAGLLVGDLLLEASNTALTTTAALREALARHDTRRPLPLLLLRAGCELKVEVMPAT